MDGWIGIHGGFMTFVYRYCSRPDDTNGDTSAKFQAISGNWPKVRPPRRKCSCLYPRVVFLQSEGNSRRFPS